MVFMSPRVRFAVFTSVLVTAVGFAAASPIIVPPLPTQGKFAASSPVIVPPMPTTGKLVASGKLIAS